MGENCKFVVWEDSDSVNTDSNTDSAFSELLFQTGSQKLYKGFVNWFSTFCVKQKTVTMSIIFPISNGMFPSQNAPKELFDLNKDIIFIMELYKLYKIGRKSTRSSLGSKTQTLYFWNNYSKLTLKNYLKIKRT